jgi:zinc protease
MRRGEALSMKRWLLAAMLVGSTALAQKAPGPAPTAPGPVRTAPPTGQAPPDPWAGRTDLFQAPRTAPNLKLDVGKVDRFTLKNGLEVLVVPRPDVPVVDLLLTLKAGGNDEPIDQVGLAQFVASMLHKGTQKRTADQISQLVDFAGASFGVSADDYHSVASCHARARDLPLCLDLTSDVMAHATFPESEMKEVHDQLEASVEAMKDNPQALADAHAQNLYFGDDDLRGRPMSKRSLAAIDRKALVAFYKTWYAPNHALLAVAGDVDGKTIRAQLEKAFAGWKRHPVPKQRELELPPKASLKVRIVDKPDATQASIVIVGPGIAHRSPEYYATRLMAFTLGAGGFSSRLMKVVRSEGGKTYGARLGYAYGPVPGPWTASTFTRISETGPTLKLVFDAIAEMQRGGPTAEELAAAKGHEIGAAGLMLETASVVAHTLVGSRLDHMDEKAIEEFPRRMDAVTIKDAAAAAGAHLAPAALVVVGPAAQVRPLIEKAGFHVDEVVRFDESVSAADRKLEAAQKH